jgi:hypothetical protein
MLATVEFPTCGRNISRSPLVTAGLASWSGRLGSPLCPLGE